MASLTATALPALGIVKLVLDWAPYRHEPVSIYRIEPDGREVQIIGSPLALSGTVAIAYDTTPPLDVDLTYRAELADPTVVRDDMGGSASNSWGTPDFTIPSGTWSNTGTNGDYQRASGVGTQRHTGTGLARITYLPGTYADVQIGATMAAPVTPLGAGLRTSLVTRYIDTSNHYQFNIIHNVSGTIGLNIIKRVAGAETIIASSTTSFTTSPNRLFRIVAQSVGNRHRMAVWWATGEGDAAILEVSDPALSAAGKVGARSLLPPTNTNTLPVTFTFDAFRVIEFGTHTLTSGVVHVDAAPHGWVRDPVNPANSVRLDNCADHTFSCLGQNQMVFFQGFGSATYRATTGVFEVNNSERPITVAQQRKAPVQDLRFASVTLDDIKRVRTLFRSGRNLSLYLPLVYGWGLDTYGADMFTAGDLTEARLNTVDMRKPYRLWTTEIVPTDEDDDLPHFTVGGNGVPVPGATFGDMKATGKTFGQLKATGNTFLDFAQGSYV